MCQAAGEWHLVGVSSWRRGCTSIGKRPRLYDRVTLNSEWAQKTILMLEETESIDQSSQMPLVKEEVEENE